MTSRDRDCGFAPVARPEERGDLMTPEGGGGDDDGQQREPPDGPTPEHVGESLGEPVRPAAPPAGGGRGATVVVVIIAVVLVGAGDGSVKAVISGDVGGGSEGVEAD